MAHVRPLGARTGRHDAAGVPRSHPAASRRGDARRLRRQCEPRAAHAARGALRASSTRCSARRATMPQARERFLAIMKTQATRMARLIDDLLSLSRIELNEHMHPETPVDLVPIVRQVVDGLQTLATDRNVEIAIALPADARDRAGDRDELTRVFENLVENALKYGASGKRVDIGFADRGARRRRRSAGDGPRLRPGHRGRAHAAPDRALLSRRRHAKPRRGRHRTGPRAGQAHPQPPPRQACQSRARPGKGATFTVRLPLIHSASAAVILNSFNNFNSLALSYSCHRSFIQR